MPELPEVETVRRGIAPHICGHTITRLIVRDGRLRWPVPRGLDRKLRNQTVASVTRRAKYLLFTLPNGTLILHLGMSGSLRLLPAGTPADKHDHVDVIFGDHCLRFNDPRRFGSIHWTEKPPEQHWLIKSLGVEPLAAEFSGKHLHQRSRGRRVAVKNFLMDGHVVVGVGNIYASESLFQAGIHPARAAGRISRLRYDALAKAVKKVLRSAIKAGGTTLRDFVNGDGKPGYFSIQLKVYGRAGEPCAICETIILKKVIGQRASFYCPTCQH